MIRYAYTVNGRTYEGTRLRFSDVRFTSERRAREILRRYTCGSTVDVRYDPISPEESTIQTDKAGLAKMVFGMMLVLLAAAAFAGEF